MISARSEGREQADSAFTTAAAPDPVGRRSAGELADTASAQLIGLLRDTARRVGVAPEQLAGIHGVDGADARGELDRVPMSSLVRLWELLAHTGPRAGLAVVDDAPLGRLSTWDYLITTSATLTESLRAAQPYHRLVTGAAERFQLGYQDGLTISYRTTAQDPATSSIVNEYVLGYYLRRAREALDRPVTPARVTFGHPAPPEHRALVEIFGTRRIEFDAPADTITFTPADAEAPLVRSDPALAELLRGHADLVLATARPIPGPLDAFRHALAAALDAGDPGLAVVASRLAISPRSLQRRLAEHNSSWRRELDLLRYRRAEALLDSGLTTTTVATRLGFTDDRALRKAFHRWRGTPPRTSPRH
ncbi:AraC family transcriptional regulator [Nocardia fusca]|uniref:AraC family transcriptional regulator ligand-binding domain-containing protein n=1 Tax=Nocardia fusca TaxID=941183 RepID=A0ABV3F295_9NOCA